MSDDAAALIAGLCCARLASILLPTATHRMLAAVALGLAVWALLQAVAS